MAKVTHDNEILTPAVASAQAGSDATYYGVWDSDPDGGGSPKFLWGNSFSNNPAAAAEGDRWRIAAGGIVYTQNATASRESDETAKRKLEGLISGGLYVTFHSGNPGTNGANRITGAKVFVTAWTVS